MLEIAWTAILLRQEGFSLVEPTGNAPGTLRRIRAVEERNVSVADITEPY
jgi:hypothetical protein